MSEPTNAPFPWATDTNFASGPRSGQPTKNAGLTVGAQMQGLISGLTLPADNANAVLNNFYQWLEFLRTERSFGFFGDASDMDWTTSIDGAIPSRVTQFDNLTVDDAQTPSHPIFVRGTLTITGAGSMSRAGVDGTNGTTVAVGVGGTAVVTGSLGVGGDGGDGGLGAGNGVVGLPSTTTEVHLGGAGGDGGDGGGPEVGGNGGIVSVAAELITTTPTVLAAGMRTFLGPGGTPAWARLEAGGGGGGGAGGGAGGGGGGGGSGGGVIVVCANRIVLDGTIDVSGGDGGDGGTGGNTGGGGGGGGGVIALLTLGRTGAGTLNVAGGTAGPGLGTGVAGVNGSDGRIIEVTL